MSGAAYNSKYFRRLRLSRRKVHTGKPSCCGPCWRAYSRDHMRRAREGAVVEIKRTIVRKLRLKVGDVIKTVVLYIQPDGLLVFREFKKRRRFAVSVAETMARAVKIGPVDGIFAGILDGVSSPKRRKKNADSTKEKGEAASS